MDLNDFLVYLDSADLSPIERIDLIGQINSLFNQAAKLKQDPTKGFERLDIQKKIDELARKVGFIKSETRQQEQPHDVAPVVAPETVVGADTQEEPARIKLSLTKRQKLNNAAILLLVQIENGSVTEPLTTEQREVLAGYSGSGGGLLSAKGETGSPHEYYTPKPVAKAMWDMLGGIGFKGGKVLDPSAGMGVFAQTKPKKNDAVATKPQVDVKTPNKTHK